MSPPIRDKIIRNTFYSIIGRFWTIVVGLVLIPYIVNMVGVERFGVWALLSILVGYFALMDFGVGVSFTRFIAEAYAKNDPEEINRIVNSGLTFYLIVSIPIVAIAYLIQGPIFNILNIDIQSFPDALIAYYGVLFIFLLSTALGGFNSVLLGIQRIDITNKIAVAVTIPNVIATVVFLKSGYKLDGLMWASMCSSLFGFVFSIYYAKKKFPQLRFNPLLYSWTTLQKLLTFGLKMQFAKFADIVTFQTDKAFVSYFSGLQAVTYYHLGAQINWRIRDIPMLLLSSLLPAASELHTLKDERKLLDVYERGTKYLAVIATPLIFFLIATAHIVMKVWMGSGFTTSAIVSQILAVGYLFNILAGVGIVIAAGMNRPNYQWYAAMMTTVTNILLVILLGFYWGLYGIAIAISISMLIGPIYFFIAFHQHIHLPLLNFLKRNIIIPLIIAFALMSVLWIINLNFFSSLSGRVINLLLLISEFIFYFSIYSLFLVRSRVFDKIDLELFTNNYLYSKFRNIFRFRK